MVFPFKNNQWGNALYATSAIVLGMGVLFVSLSRASMQIWANEDKENKLRTKPVDFIINYKNGSTEPASYKLPEVKTLRTDPMYGVKEMRNSVWMGMVKDPAGKVKMALLIADKKMTEAQILIDRQESKLALETSAEAIDKLKYAYSEIPGIDDNIEAEKIKGQIIKAGYAYAELLKQAESSISADNAEKVEYKEKINDLNKWNEEKQIENDQEKISTQN